MSFSWTWTAHTALPHTHRTCFRPAFACHLPLYLHIAPCPPTPPHTPLYHFAQHGAWRAHCTWRAPHAPHLPAHRLTTTRTRTPLHFAPHHRTFAHCFSSPLPPRMRGQQHCAGTVSVVGRWRRRHAMPKRNDALQRQHGMPTAPYWHPSRRSNLQYPSTALTGFWMAERVQQRRLPPTTRHATPAPRLPAPCLPAYTSPALQRTYLPATPAPHPFPPFPTCPPPHKTTTACHPLPLHHLCRFTCAARITFHHTPSRNTATPCPLPSCPPTPLPGWVGAGGWMFGGKLPTQRTAKAGVCRYVSSSLLSLLT